MHLEFHLWEGTKTVPPANVEMADKDVNRKLIKHSGRLMAKEWTDDIRNKKGEITDYVKQIALDFPIKGVKFIPKEKLEEAVERFEIFRKEYDKLAEELNEKKGEIHAQAKKDLCSLYNPSDYPVDFRNNYSFDYRFLELSAPGESSVLPPSLYKQEKEKFLNLIGEFRKDAVDSLRVEFATLVDNLSDTLQGLKDGTKKRFHSSHVDNIHKFLEKFEALNIGNDADLKSQIDLCREFLKDKDVDDIKNSNFVRESTNAAMKMIQQNLDDMLVKRATRMITVPKGLTQSNEG